MIQTGEDITKAQSDLVVAQKKEKEQYAAMKKRIKYMYEAGNDSAFETLVTSDDFTDLLSKAEYVQNVHSYDRKQLQEYVETKQQISDLKDSLEKIRKNWKASRLNMRSRCDNLNNLITSKSAEVANLDSEIQAAAEAVAKEAAERAAKEAAEKAAKEAAKKQQASAANNSTSSNRNNSTTSNNTTSNKNNTSNTTRPSRPSGNNTSSSTTKPSGNNTSSTQQADRMQMVASIVSRAYSRLWKTL
ncbi:MAG: coiled-coil domain-containing protein [Blautia obeum]